MTITKALRKLYKVIVGEEAPANANTITKVLLALAEAWTGSGGGSGGGGGETIMVIYNDDVETLNKTCSEISEMLLSGGSPFVVDIDSGNFAATPFCNLGYVTQITHSDRDGTGIVSVSGPEGDLTYTADWNDYPIRTNGSDS